MHNSYVKLDQSIVANANILLYINIHYLFDVVHYLGSQLRPIKTRTLKSSDQSQALQTHLNRYYSHCHQISNDSRKTLNPPDK